MMTVNIKLMTQTMHGCLILDKLGRRKLGSAFVSESGGNTAMFTVKI